MMFPVVLDGPTPADLYARNSFIAAFVCLLLAIGLWANAKIRHTKDEKLKLPRLFWFFGGSAIVLLILGVAGAVAVWKTESEAERLAQEKWLREKGAKWPNKSPEPTPTAVTPRAIEPKPK